MVPELISIVSNIAEYSSKQAVPSSNISSNIPKFIYFNKQNLAYKSTIHLDNKRTGNLACPLESVQRMADIKNSTSNDEASEEIIAKTMDDSWIAGKSSNLREFYVALQQKNASLIDISGEYQIYLQNMICTTTRIL